MSILEVNIPVGIGDLIIFKGQLDGVKSRYEEIKISLDNDILQYYRHNDPKFLAFINELAALLFSEPPYRLNVGQFTRYAPWLLARDHNIPPKISDLSSYLCKGDSLNLNRPYMVFTTKVRFMPKSFFLTNRYHEFWHLMRQISEKYKVVVLGERVVEANTEYQGNEETIYSLYYDIMSAIPNDRILDLSIPALGITAPDLKQLQQDCLIMHESDFVLSMGIGGNLQISMAVANTVNFRHADSDDTAILYGETVATERMITTRIYDNFFRKLEYYRDRL